MQLLIITLILIGTTVGNLPGGQTGQAAQGYPNELPGLELYARGKWKSLEPFSSRKLEVDRVLGQPSPVLIPYDNDWQVLVRYHIGGATGDQPWPETLKGTISSINFYPRRRVSLKGLVFSKAFVCRVVKDESTSLPLTRCTDKTGLSYVIYKGTIIDGKVRSGDLKEIVYGVSDEVLERYTKQ